MFERDCQDRRTIYEQIIDWFRKMISSGALETNTMIPAAGQLAEDWSVNPNIVERAYRHLEREGYLFFVEGKGGFVSSPDKYRAKERQAFLVSLKSLVEQGRRLDVTREEFDTYAEEYYREEA